MILNKNSTIILEYKIPLTISKAMKFYELFKIFHMETNVYVARSKSATNGNIYDYAVFFIKTRYIISKKEEIVISFHNVNAPLSIVRLKINKAFAQEHKDALNNLAQKSKSILGKNFARNLLTSLQKIRIAK